LGDSKCDNSSASDQDNHGHDGHGHGGHGHNGHGHGGHDHDRHGYGSRGSKRPPESLLEAIWGPPGAVLNSFL